MPTADFSFAQTTQLPGETVAFTDLSVTDDPETVAGWAWNFGDGGTSTAQNPAHAYAAHGIYDVVLEITDSADETASVTRQLVIIDQTAEPVLSKPAADFSVSGQSGDAPLEIAFLNRSTGTISGFAWSFGDGVTSNDENPQHTFEEPGSYTVSLTVFNGSGLSSMHTFRIDVLAPETSEEPDREETAIDLVRSIRAGLRRVSEQKLRYKDILDVVNDLLRGYARDLQVSEQDHRTDEKTGRIAHLEGNNYLLKVEGVPEVEVMSLSFVTKEQFESNQNNLAWREVTLMPLSYYSERALSEVCAGALFGGMLVADGVKIKLSLDRETIENAVWKVRYRAPLLRLLTLSAKTPLPADMLPMIKTEARLGCLQFIRDDSKEFKEWRKLNESLMVASVRDWRSRWDDFLNTSTEPPVLPKNAFNEYRRGYKRQPRITIERRNS